MLGVEVRAGEPRGGWWLTETQVKGKAETDQLYKLRTYNAQGPLPCILEGHAGT